MDKTVNAKTYFDNLKENFKRWLSKCHPLAAGASVVFIIIIAIFVFSVLITVVPTLIFISAVIAFMWVLGSMIQENMKEKEASKTKRT